MLVCFRWDNCYNRVWMRLEAKWTFRFFELASSLVRSNCGTGVMKEELPVYSWVCGRIKMAAETEFDSVLALIFLLVQYVFGSDFNSWIIHIYDLIRVQSCRVLLILELFCTCVPDFVLWYNRLQLCRRSVYMRAKWPLCWRLSLVSEAWSN